MAEILGATDGEIIDSLREDLLTALQEIARLEAENARLKAPVSDEEVKIFWLTYHHCKKRLPNAQNGYNSASSTQIAFEEVFAARAKGGNDGK